MWHYGPAELLRCLAIIYALCVTRSCHRRSEASPTWEEELGINRQVYLASQDYNSSELPRYMDYGPEQGATAALGLCALSGIPSGLSTLTLW